MVRAPCCPKTGLKKGPWSCEEDRILTSYIRRYGHDNWRALPRHAGLSRCGKSCRLRWINYLSPHIKRGNFSSDEEETIVKLHKALGNRWSAIAARLPGRTDNEIKNVWHTHLKKKLNQKSDDIDTVQESSDHPRDEFDQMVVTSTPHENDTVEDHPISLPQSSSISDASNCENTINNINNDINASIMTEYSPSRLISGIDGSFWSEAFSTETYDSNFDSKAMNCFSPMSNNYNDINATIMTAYSPSCLISEIDDSLWSEAFSTETYDSSFDSEAMNCFSTMSNNQELQFPLLETSNEQNDMDFWFNILMRTEDLSELLQDEF